MLCMLILMPVMSAEHNWLFVSDFDFLLLMDVTVGDKLLCTDLHCDACLDVCVGLQTVTVEGYKGRVRNTLW